MMVDGGEDGGSDVYQSLVDREGDTIRTACCVARLHYGFLGEDDIDLSDAFGDPSVESAE